jgi:hypothetical protein
VSRQAISAVDLALWDVLGKLRREPVGREYCVQKNIFSIQEDLPVYSATYMPGELHCHLHSPALPIIIIAYASPWGLLELRYHVPTDQQRETEDWIKLLTEARQKVGEDFPLM